VDGGRLDLIKGRGIVEFHCPELPFEVAAFNVEVAIKRRASSFNEHVDYKSAASINVTKGKPVHGVFHTPHTWNIRSVPSEQVDHVEANAVVKNVD
jgi:hypothetical protein